jgi:competence protein ComEC
LWDAGFQLSYAAVLSIVIFMQPIYNWLYFHNRFINAIWKLVAVTLAAQLLTTPVSMFHFHQFPVYFLLTNLLAVPLSGIIILLEIFLYAVAFIPAIAQPTGIVLHKLIFFMNKFIEHMENMPFSLWNGMQLNILQLIFLYGFIAAMAYWLMRKNMTAVRCGLVCLLGFLSIRTWSFIAAGRQQQLIVYNLPKHQAMDFMSGRNYVFHGDAALLADAHLQDFHLKPSRILHRVASADTVSLLQYAGPIFLFNHKKIILADGSCKFGAAGKKIKADLIIISKNAPVQLTGLLRDFDCRQLVFDASCPFYKVNKWKAEAAKLGLYCFSVVDNGAFVMNMD